MAIGKPDDIRLTGSSGDVFADPGFAQSEEQFEVPRVTDEPTGRSLVEAFAQSPHRAVEIEPPRGPMPVRDAPL